MPNGVSHALKVRTAAVAGFCQQHALVVLPVALVLAALAAWLVAARIGINTNTEDMLSEQLPWRVAYAEFKREFPFFADTIVVVVDARTADDAVAAAALLSARLAQNEADFIEVFHPEEDPFLRRNGLLFASVAELEDLGTRLAGGQALLGRLAASPRLETLLELLIDIERADNITNPDDVARVVARIAERVAAFNRGDEIPLSWRDLLLDTSASSSRAVFTVRPRLDYSQPIAAAAAIDALRAEIAASALDQRRGVSIRLTGPAALAYDELNSVIRGATQAGIAAFVLVGLSLFIGLRSVSLVVATLLTLVVGLVFTAGFAALVVGTLNMISVAFAVLYVGLGVDFAIHLCLRYRELVVGHAREDAIVGAVSHIGTSIVICALSTALAFFAFIPTAYRGVAELGLISGGGMIIGIITTFTVLPALLAILPTPRAPQLAPAEPVTAQSRRPRGAPILLLAAVAVVIALLVLSNARFDLNPVHLNDPQAESVITLDALAADGEQPLYTISALRQGRDAASELAAALTSVATVARVQLPDDLVPPDQDDKLLLIEDLGWTLGDVLDPAPRSAPESARIMLRLQTLARLLGETTAAPPALAEARSALGTAIDALNDRLLMSSMTTRDGMVHALDEVLLAHFIPQVERLADALEAQAFALEDLPPALRARWISDNGYHRVAVVPRDDMNDDAALVAFVESVREIIGPQATGTPVINFEAARAVVAAFAQAFAAAIAAIAILLWLILRRAAEVAVVLAPLVMAGVLTGAAAVLSGVSFNFANIIALPLLMGIGVDSALHILHRYKERGEENLPLLRSSTARAVLFSALTTTASFGNLALSPHAGTASMGVMLTIGLAVTLVCTLVILPALLERFVDREIAA